MSSLLPLLEVGGLPTWMTPGCVSLNRLPMRATCYPFPDPEGARKLPREASPWFRLLDGRWRFRMATRPGDVTPADMATGTDRSAWDEVDVPGNWAFQEYGHPHYTNVQMPSPDEPPGVPADNSTGIYAARVVVPGEWEGRRTIVHFGGAEACSTSTSMARRSV